MAVNLSPVGGVAAQFFSNNGVPLTGGKLFTYSAGTTTPAATYISSNGNTAWTNPIVLDAAGRVPSGGEIWLTDGVSYKFVLKDSNDVLIATYDNIIGINSNYVNFTNQQEIQTATAGQTVFTLTTMTYQPGTGSLSVFVDGVNQYGPSTSYAFVETDSTTVTFTNGLHVGALVKFTTSAINASSYGNAYQVAYTPPFSNSVATNVGDKLSEYISVKDFGAVGDGVTDDTDAINNAFAVGGNIQFPHGTYLYDGGSFSTSCWIDLCGSTIKRFSGTGGFITSTGAVLVIKNGTFNNENLSANFAHSINYDNASGYFELDSVSVLNNCLGYPTPTANQDIDLVYINRSAKVYVNNCTFSVASRQGISLTGACNDVTITNNKFETCYLFGIDFEPNTSSYAMYESVVVTGNTFKNCGPQTNTNKVWNSGGPFSIASATTNVVIARDVVIDGNTINSDSYVSPDAGVEPYIQIEQFENCTFSNNVIQNIDRLTFATIDATAVIRSLAITGNTLDNLVGGMGCTIYSYNAKNLVVSNNTLSALIFDGDNVTISGNTFFVATELFAIKANSSAPSVSITGNSFSGMTTVIDTSNKTSGYIVVGNTATGYTTFIGTVTNSQIVGNSDGVSVSSSYRSTLSQVSVPSGSATTIFTLGGSKKAGLISVQDSGGTVIGAYALFGNFFDLGSNNQSFLSSVQNSVSGSALTLSGQNIQFAHTFGSTRIVNVSVLYFN